MAAMSKEEFLKGISTSELKHDLAWLNKLPEHAMSESRIEGKRLLEAELKRREVSE